MVTKWEKAAADHGYILAAPEWQKKVGSSYGYSEREHDTVTETLKDHNANVQKWRMVEKDLKVKAAPTAADTPTTAAPGPAAKARAVVRTVPPAKTPPADKAAAEAASPKR